MNYYLSFKKIIQRLSSLKITVICLFVLFVLTFWGTIFQAENGIYKAQTKFFHSLYFFEFGFLPFPGGMLIMWILSVNLVCNFFYNIKSHLKKPGILAIHLGLIILMAGSFLTFIFSQESFLDLDESESRNSVSDYREWELVAYYQNKEVNTPLITNDIYSWNTREFQNENQYEFPQLSLVVKVIQYMPNCNALSDPQDPNNFILTNLKRANDPQEEIPGGIFQIITEGNSREVKLWGGVLSTAQTVLETSEGALVINLRKLRRTIPLVVTLNDFKHDQYQGTTIPISYESEITVDDHKTSRDVKIFMNNPFRYKNYTFFQSSFQIDNDGNEKSVFSVVKNDIRLTPYISTGIIFIGLLYHFLSMMFRYFPKSTIRRQKKLTHKRLSSNKTTAILFFLMVSFLSFNQPLYANESNHFESTVDAKFFGHLPILEGGRIKPLESFAINTLLLYSGKKKLITDNGRISAIDWLVELFFNPNVAFERKVFLIKNPEILDAVGIERTTQKRYSFNELQSHYEKLSSIARNINEVNEQFKKRTRKDRNNSPFEREVLGLSINLYNYVILAQAFQYVIPSLIFSIDHLETKKMLELSLDKKDFSYLNLIVKKDLITQFLKQKNLSSEIKNDLINLNVNLASYPQRLINPPFYILPVMDSESQLEGKIRWIHLNQLITFAAMDHSDLVANGDQLIYKEINQIDKMAKNYLENDQKAFNQSVIFFRDKINDVIESNFSISRIKVELLYNAINPLLWTHITYILSFLLILANLLVFKQHTKNKLIHQSFFYKVSFGVLTVGFILNLVSIVARMFISSRPPITNLFETFIFVACIGIFFALLLEFFNKNALSLLCGSIMGLSLMFISNKFSGDGDTIKVLQAVLDSNFWLSTHVVTISLGYTGVILAGIIAHLYIIYSFFKKTQPQTLSNVMRMVYATLAFGLIFSFIGTVLGGIWADQSWGRFWGWDPKENGALMIVLWCALLFHGRFSGWFTPLLFCAGAAIGIIVVMFAWFGINLLSVGLHSYGFINGVFEYLVLYTLIQLLFVFISLTIIYYRQSSKTQEKLE